MHPVVELITYMVPMWLMMIFMDMDTDRYVAFCFASFALLELIRVRIALEEHNE